MPLWSLPFWVGRWKIQPNYYIMSGGNRCHDGLQNRVWGLGDGGYCFICGDENSGGFRGKGFDAKCLPLVYVEH